MITRKKKPAWRKNICLKDEGLGSLSIVGFLWKSLKTGVKQQVISHFYKCQANKKYEQMKLGFAWHYNVFNVVLYLFQYQFDVLETFFRIDFLDLG